LGFRLHPHERLQRNLFHPLEPFSTAGNTGDSKAGMRYKDIVEGKEEGKVGDERFLNDFGGA
jgi:hypothetical protein